MRWLLGASGEGESRSLAALGMAWCFVGGEVGLAESGNNFFIWVGCGHGARRCGAPTGRGRISNFLRGGMGCGLAGGPVGGFVVAGGGELVG